MAVCKVDATLPEILWIKCLFVSRGQTVWDGTRLFEVLYSMCARTLRFRKHVRVTPYMYGALESADLSVSREYCTAERILRGAYWQQCNVHAALRESCGVWRLDVHHTSCPLLVCHFISCMLSERLPLHIHKLDWYVFLLHLPLCNMDIERYNKQQAREEKSSAVDLQEPSLQV